jgi:predicted ATPase
MASDKSGLVLVEEPESHQHARSLRQVAQLFWQATAQGKQIVAATHSLEYIDAQFLDATPEQLSRAVVFRTFLKDGELRAVRVPGEKVRELRLEIGEDLRR